MKNNNPERIQSKIGLYWQVHCWPDQTIQLEKEFVEVAMTVRDIVFVPDPVLRKKAKTVTQFDEKLQTLISDPAMRARMGLAGRRRAEERAVGLPVVRMRSAIPP